MLVLSRFTNERIMIGDDIEIMVVDVHPNGKVKLGITAPAEVSVDRPEVRAAKLRDGGNVHAV